MANIIGKLKHYQLSYENNEKENDTKNYNYFLGFFLMSEFYLIH